MSENKSYLDELVGDKPESFEEEVFIKAPFNYRPIITVGIIVALIVMTVISFKLVSRVKVPDTEAWTMIELRQWVKKNELTPMYIEVYSLEVAVDGIISMEIMSGDKIDKKAVFSVTYSLGPDPNELIALIDFKGKTLEQVELFISDYQMLGISIKKEYSTIVESGIVINYEFKDGSEDKFLRKNRMTIYVSQGTESLDSTFKMPDFVGKSKADVLEWVSKEKVDVELSYSFSTTVAYDKVFEQSIKADTKMTRSDKVKVTVSRGEVIVVPDLVGMDKAQVITLADFNGYKVFFDYEVSGSPEDTVISQDIEAQTEIDSNTLLTVSVAKSSDYIELPDFVGLTSDEAATLGGLYPFNVFLKSVDSTKESGRIVGQSSDPGKWVSKDSIIFVEVSNGSALVPNFMQMDRVDADIVSKQLNLEIIYKELDRTDYMDGTIMSQSVEMDEVVPRDAVIVCEVVVNNGKLIKDLQDMSRNEAEVWAETNNVKLSIIDAYSDDLPQGKLFGQNVVAGYVGSDTSLVVYYSLGKVAVLDFIGKNKIEALDWAAEVNKKGALVDIKFALTTSSKYERGIVSDQPYSSGFLKIGSSLVLTVSSSNNGVKIPDLKSMSYNSFITWATSNDVPYIVADSYSDTYSIDQMFGQNYSGRSLPNGEVLKITRSLGVEPVE